MSTRILPLALACMFVPACDLFSQPEPAPLPDEGLNGDGAGCKEEATVIAGLDAATALGFTAAEVLASAGGPHMSAMTWSGGLADGPVDVELSPAAGDTELTVTIDYAGGEIRHIKSTPEGFDEGNDGGFVAECHDRIEIDVEVAVASADGGLAESFVAPLRATSRGISTLRHTIEFADLAGSLALAKVEPADAKIGPLDLDIGVSPSGLFGSASALVEVEIGGGVGATFMNVARWPSGATPCDELGEAPVALDDKIALFSAADALALAAKASGLSLTWQGQDPTELTLGLAHDGDSICARYEGESVGSLRFGATATVKTADGRWDGAFPVEISVQPAADGTLASVQFYRYAPYGETVPAADFAAFFGLQDVDLTGYDAASLDFSGEFTPAGEAAAASGKLDVLGVIQHMCSNEPGAPCMGNDVQTIESATWSSQ
jgi:hypothetical protein